MLFTTHFSHCCSLLETDEGPVRGMHVGKTSYGRRSGVVHVGDMCRSEESVALLAPFSSWGTLIPQYVICQMLSYSKNNYKVGSYFRRLAIDTTFLAKIVKEA